MASVMQSIAIGRVLRMTRVRRGQRQVDVARSARLSPATVSRHERGILASVGLLERHAAGLGLRVELQLIGRGGELARTRDEEHALIEELLAHLLEDGRFDTRPEVTFNSWGERGRVDLAAFHESRRLLVLAEAKGELTDLQQTLGAIDLRERLAQTIAGQLGWKPHATVILLAVAQTDTNRQIVRRHPRLFARFAQRTLRHGSAPVRTGDARVLLWIPSRRVGRDAWLAGRRRVRGRAPRLRRSRMTNDTGSNGPASV
jgi:transcriptional regulator with XRE-family HTH domain